MKKMALVVAALMMAALPALAKDVLVPHLAASDAYYPNSVPFLFPATDGTEGSFLVVRGLRDEQPNLFDLALVTANMKNPGLLDAFTKNVYSNWKVTGAVKNGEVLSQVSYDRLQLSLQVELMSNLGAYIDTIKGMLTPYLVEQLAYHNGEGVDFGGFPAFAAPWYDPQGNDPMSMTGSSGFNCYVQCEICSAGQRPSGACSGFCTRGCDSGSWDCVCISTGGSKTRFGPAPPDIR